MIWIGCLLLYVNMSIESFVNCLFELCMESEIFMNSRDKGYRCEISNDVLIKCGRIVYFKKKKIEKKMLLYCFSCLGFKNN